MCPKPSCGVNPFVIKFQAPAPFARAPSAPLSSARLTCHPPTLPPPPMTRIGCAPSRLTLCSRSRPDMLNRGKTVPRACDWKRTLKDVIRRQPVTSHCYHSRCSRLGALLHVSPRGSHHRHHAYTSSTLVPRSTEAKRKQTQKGDRRKKATKKKRNQRRIPSPPPTETRDMFLSFSPFCSTPLT